MRLDVDLRRMAEEGMGVSLHRSNACSARRGLKEGKTSTAPNFCLFSKFCLFPK